MSLFTKPYRSWRGTSNFDRITSRRFELDGVEVNSTPGRHLYLNPDSGSDGYGTSTRAKPYATMAKVLTELESGDTIHFWGKLQEQVVAPVQVFDVRVIGEGNRPRHADAAPVALGGIAANTWTTPVSPTAATPLIKVMQQGWEFHKILFAGPTDAASVLLFRDGGAGNLERDGSHAQFFNCRFASGASAIEQSGGCGHVGLYECFFTSLTAAALKHTGGAGIGYPIRWEAWHNRFASCPSIMTAVAAFDYSFQGNSFMFATAPTLVFDFTGGARNNMGGIERNTYNIAAVDFDPAGHVTGSGATDVWSSALTDAIETGLPAN